jgi:hypothetical protein
VSVKDSFQMEVPFSGIKIKGLFLKIWVVFSRIRTS